VVRLCPAGNKGKFPDQADKLEAEWEDSTVKDGLRCGLDDTNNDIANPKREKLTRTNKRLKNMFVESMDYTKRNASVIRMRWRTSTERVAT
jgi:hypothetical protein